MNAHKKFFSKIGVNYLIFAIAAIIIQIIVFNIASIIKPEWLNDMNAITIISSLCNYFLPFPILYWMMKKLDAVKIEKSSVSAKTFILYVAVTMTLMWIGNIIGLIITMLLSGVIQSDIANPVQELINSTDIWLNMILISIIGPICEEIIFRKIVIDRSIKYGAKVSIILSAVIFAFIHGNLNQFFYALLLGGFLSYVYIKTGKIIYPIILHITVNFMGSVVSLFVANSAMNLQTGMNPIDAAVIIIYFLFLLTLLLLGVYGLLQVKKARFNGKKTEIALKNPFRTIFLNYGMIIFIGFFIIEMARQALG